MTHDIVLLCDAGPMIGSGHAMRMITLGGALRRRGRNVVVFTSELPESLARRAEAHDLRIIHRESPIAEPSLAEEIHALDPAALVIDSYEIPSSTIRRLANDHPLVLLDDNGEHADATADVLLNQNLHADIVDYGSGFDRTRMLRGTRWALIRDEVVSHRGQLRNPPSQRVLVALGGTDPLGLGPSVSAALDSIPDAEIIHAHGLAGESPFTPEKMAESLASATAGVFACGTTIWEAATLGLPFVGVVTTDNQRLVGASLLEAGLAPVIDIRSNAAGNVIDIIVGAASEMLADADLRSELSLRLRSLIDGLGSDRVADVILELVTSRAS